MNQNQRTQLSKKELQQIMQQQQDNKSYLPWIIGGSILGVMVIGIIAYLLFKKEKRK